MISRTVVIATASRGSGGLGTAAGEFAGGLEALGHAPAYVSPEASGPIARVTNSRPFRRAFGMAASRRLRSRAARRSVPDHWDLAYAVPGSVPVDGAGGINVILQATRHPAVEWSALRRGERETGGRGDMSTAERKRREFEIERADLIHVTSRAVQEEFLEAGVPAERIVQSPHGVDLQRFTPGVKSERLKILFVGPLSLRKGIDVVADLHSRLPEEVRLDVIGGPSDPWSRRIAERAAFTHAEDEVPEALASSQALVLPSRSDGFSYVVLEALASGTVPIVTPEVGASEIVRRLDERLVVERSEFVDATLELLPQLDFADLSPRARGLAEEFDRAKTSRDVAAKVLDRAERLVT